MKRVILSSDNLTQYEDKEDQLEEIKLRMYGDYNCSCGCGQLLGRPTNGVDGKPIEYSYGVGRRDDDEGFEWRMFTEDCWNTIRSRSSISDIYYSYQPCTEV